MAVGLNTNGQLRQFNDLLITIQRDWLVFVDIVIIASKIVIIASSSNCRWVSAWIGSVESLDATMLHRKGEKALIISKSSAKNLFSLLLSSS